MPVFSLPSSFGIGDFGPGAKAFVDFLYRSGQKYWQLLPLSPTERKSGHSPYSSFSGMGINALFISPEMLAEENLLSAEKLKAYKLPFSKTIEYGKVEKIRKAICTDAYANYCKGSFTALDYDFKDYCRKQSYWLNDFALFVELKRHFRGLPWYKWPDEFRKRDKAALKEFESLHEEGIDRIKWLQFMGARQWKKLRHYANSKGIEVFGDLPFYVSYDSADVWADPEMFCLDKDGNMSGVAGVPPDYFSKTGQLWNMPTYNWEVLKETNYIWWLNRIRKNLELFDIIRLDHFRAFESYWQVPGGERTAENGKWLKGRGAHFFNIVKDQFGALPFIAEDLGDYMEDVYRFRNEIGLPGMKLLQFAWGPNMPVSVDAAHNYPLNCVVYTGTHDNNTTKGWFKTETSAADRLRLQNYTGIKVNAKNASLVLSRIAYASVAQTAILPIQDILGLDAQARINTPGASKDNWLWRLQQNALSPETEKHLYSWVQMYNRLQLF
ncbi:MAG: 4-alpha-glucanotransferase [Bacteroidetes bacterium]|nr:4-alpha-glucanotransferase [Bacteroidota bacterium]